MVPTWVSLIIAISLIFLEAWLNKRKFDRNIIIDKKLQTVFRFFGGVVLVFLTYKNAWEAARYLVFLAALFGLMFDPVIAKMRGFSAWYLNKTGPFDLFFGGLPRWLRIVTQLMLLLIGFIVWQYEYFRAFHHGIFEAGFIDQFFEYTNLLI